MAIKYFKFAPLYICISSIVFSMHCMQQESVHTVHQKVDMLLDEIFQDQALIKTVQADLSKNISCMKAIVDLVYCSYSPEQAFRMLNLLESCEHFFTMMKSNPEHFKIILKLLQITGISWSSVKKFYTTFLQYKKSFDKNATSLMQDTIKNYFDTEDRAVLHPTKYSNGKYFKIHVNHVQKDIHKELDANPDWNDHLNKLAADIAAFQKLHCLKNISDFDIFSDTLDASVSYFLSQFDARKQEQNKQQSEQLLSENTHDEEEHRINTNKSSFTPRTSSMYDETSIEKTELPYIDLHNRSVIIKADLPIAHETAQYQEVIDHEWAITEQTDYIIIKNKKPFAHSISSEKDHLLNNLFKENTEFNINAITIYLYKIPGLMNDLMHPAIEYKNYTLEKIDKNYDGHTSFWDWFHHAFPGAVNRYRKFGHAVQAGSNLKVHIPLEVRYEGYYRDNKTILREIVSADYFFDNHQVTHRCLTNMSQHQKKPDLSLYTNAIKQYLLNNNPVEHERHDEKRIMVLFSSRLNLLDSQSMQK